MKENIETILIHVTVSRDDCCFGFISALLPNHSGYGININSISSLT